MANTKRKTTVVEKAELNSVMDTTDETVRVDMTKTTPGVVKIDDSAMIKVKSNVFGELIYIDPVTDEQVSWDRCGAVNILPFAALRHMKQGAVKFFQNQLIVLTGFADENADKYEVADIYKALYITDYYKNYLDPSEYNDVGSWTADEISERVSYMTDAVKMRFVIALNTLIESGILDSLKQIKNFEKALGCELTRPE